MRRIVGVLLITLAALMLFGFLRADVEQPPLVIGLTLLLAVGVPAGAGIALLRSTSRGRNERLATLRQETIEAEVLRLAGLHGGRLAAVEVIRDLGVSVEDANGALEALMRRGLADIEITPSGGIVYAFPDVRLLDEKSQAKGLLDD